MTNGERIRTRRKQLGTSVDDLAAKLGTIYRYESDAIEMPASLLKPLANALDTIPDELMGWGDLLLSEMERQDKMSEVLPLIVDGVSVEGKNQKYALFKSPTYGGQLESNFRSLLLTLYHINLANQGSKMRTIRILGELVSYREFLDTQDQKKRGTSIEHPYQRE